MTFKFFKNNEYNMNANAYSNHFTGFRIKSGMTKESVSSLYSSVSSLGERSAPLSSLGEQSETRGSIKHTIRFITAVCMTLMISTVALSEETSTETCANGAGTVITGAVSGRKYCKSNNAMNWWNAHAWCDALNRRLFSMNDCEFSGTSTACNDLKGVGGEQWIWTATPSDPSLAYYVRLSSGNFANTNYRDNLDGYALCY